MKQLNVVEQFAVLSLSLLVLGLVALMCICSGCAPESVKVTNEAEAAIDDGYMALAVAMVKPAIAEKPAPAPPAPEVVVPDPVIEEEEEDPKRHTYYFTASWCSPCQRWKANELPRLRASGWTKEWLTTVDIDRNGELKNKYGITTVPAFVVVKNGRVLGTRIGYVDYITLAKWANSL